MLTKSTSMLQENNQVIMVFIAMAKSIGVRLQKHCQHQRQILMKSNWEIHCGAKLTTMATNMYLWQKYRKVWEMLLRMKHCLKQNLQLLEHSILLENILKDIQPMEMTIWKNVISESFWLLWESGLSTLLHFKR